MAQSSPGAPVPVELRQLVAQYRGPVADFCWYMLGGDEGQEEALLTIFRRFGDLYRRSLKKSGEPSSQRWDVLLFHLAWQEIAHHLREKATSWPSGRDTRRLQGFETNLLSDFASPKPNQLQDAFRRLALVDPELRAPLVLKDVLKLDDEMILPVLKLRWGVYRHRLHRGRVEFMEALKGQDKEATPARSNPALRPSSV